jgi:hypothetical protein
MLTKMRALHDGQVRRFQTWPMRTSCHTGARLPALDRIPTDLSRLVHGNRESTATAPGVAGVSL